MKETTYRDLAITRINTVICDFERAGRGGNFKRFARPYYLFGIRRYFPYKVWLEELKLAALFVDTGQPAELYSTWRSRLTVAGYHKTNRPAPTAPGQLNLLEGL